MASALWVLLVATVLVVMPAVRGQSGSSDLLDDSTSTDVVTPTSSEEPAPAMNTTGIITSDATNMLFQTSADDSSTVITTATSNATTSPVPTMNTSTVTEGSGSGFTPVEPLLPSLTTVETSLLPTETSSSPPPFTPSPTPTSTPSPTPTSISSPPPAPPPSTPLALPPITTSLLAPTTTIFPTTTSPPPSSPSASTTTSSTPRVTNPSSSGAAVAAGLVVGMLVIAALVAVIFFLLFIVLRRRRSKSSGDMDHLLNFNDSNQIALKDFSIRPGCRVNLEELFSHIPNNEPVMLTDLEQHINALEDEDNDDEEFILVQEKDQEFSCRAAKSQSNCDKNRYINILPYDQTRVLLTDLPKCPGSNYINANYIAGYNNSTEYIAAQGPLASTVPDFWRMVWEQGTRIIVMVTNPVEGGITKCEVYWPRPGSGQQCGLVSVVNTQEDVLPTCTVRKLMLSVAQKTKNKNREVVSREVTQFCFTGWPDMGVPADASSMLKFVYRVRSAVTSEDGPIVVHCSAGVGRTGTFIAIDVQLQRMVKEENLNVPQFVMQMRAQRSFMVQTEPQYLFIYKTILHAYLYGRTELSHEDLRGHIEKLQQAFPNSEDSHLDKEFMGASSVPEPEEEEQSAALSYRNADKNRNRHFLPLDSNRVILSDPECSGDDYINASFVGVLGRTKEYVVAEHPVPDMVEEYWRMILDRGITTIVILGPILDDDDVYWPTDEDPMEHGSVSLQFLAQESEKEVSACMVEADCEETEACQAVCLLQLTDWPIEAGEVPSSPAGLLQLMKLVKEHSKGKLLVHSSSSLKGEASGVFCLANSLSRRLVEGASVDVMKSTSHLLAQRPEVITSKEQYLFIYEVLSAFK